MNQADVLKNAIIKGIKEITLNSNLINVFSDIDDFQIGDSAEIFSNLEFANNIKEYIEKILISQLENKLSEISDVHKMTWKIDAYNIAKEVLDSPKVSSLKQNLDNILENCITQIRSELMRHEPVPVFEKGKEFQPYFPLKSAEAPIQPLQTKFSELSQFTLTTKPANVRIKAYELLISSHYADTVTQTNWTELQQTIQEGLIDDNMDVFKLCLKLHAKLLSCSSFEIVKDIFLNLLESLCKHYNGQESEYEIISLSNYIHYRMISIANLIINTIKLITQNVARFGSKRLEEIIDNLVHLISIHYSSKSIRRKHLLSPFEILSCLDPMGRWCVYFTHGVVTRNILLNSNCNKARNNLLQIIVEELNMWFSNPIIPDELNIDLNCINPSQVKFAVFTHSLSIFVTICSYEMGRAFFPLFINKYEECVTISAITEKVILFLNDKIKKELNLNKTFSSSFIDFVVACANKLFIIRENQTTLLQAVLNPLQQIPPTLFSHTLSILNSIPQCECDKHFFMKNLTLGRKRGSQLSRASVSAHCFRNKQCRSSSEQQNTLCTENNYLCISDILMNALSLILENKDTEYPIHLVSQLIYVFGKFLIQNDGLCSILTKENINKISHILAVIYTINVEENLKNVIRTQVIDFNRACQDLFFQIGGTPLGAYLTKEENILDFILCQALDNPEIPWTCATWRLFTSHCCQYIGEENALATQNSSLIKQQLLKLWDVIDTNCSGSDLYIQLAIKNFLIVVTSFGCNMNGVKAVFLEPAEGSDVTLTDQTEVRPTNIATLIQYLALSVDDIYDTTFHQIALLVLQIFVSNLDTNLYLQHFLQFQDHLLQLQSNNRIDESSDIIIDECSTLRHAILEQSYFTRHARTDIKLYCTPPQGTSTLHRVKMKPKFNGELPKFLQDTKTCLHDMNWLKQARKIYRASVAENIKGTTLQDIIEQVKKCLPDTNVGIKWAAAEVKLFDEDVLGIQFVIRYGANNRLLQPTQQNADNLGHLICLARAGMGSQLDKFTGFDWFVATVFLICSGNIERCQNFLSCVKALPTANYIWSSLTSNGDKGFAVLGQLLDFILANELPCGFYTLQTNGMSWWLICRQWIRECFWNLLDWNLICHWLMLCVLQQTEYIIYFCAALLQVNEQYILKLSREGNLYQIITNPIGKFQMTDILPFMDNLCKRYHNILSCKFSSLL